MLVPVSPLQPRSMNWPKQSDPRLTSIDRPRPDPTTQQSRQAGRNVASTISKHRSSFSSGEATVIAKQRSTPMSPTHSMHWAGATKRSSISNDRLRSSPISVRQPMVGQRSGRSPPGDAPLTTERGHALGGRRYCSHPRHDRGPAYPGERRARPESQQLTSQKPRDSAHRTSCAPIEDQVTGDMSPYGDRWPVCATPCYRQEM